MRILVIARGSMTTIEYTGITQIVYDGINFELRKPDGAVDYSVKDYYFTLLFYKGAIICIKI